jgi:uncharacterized cupin superfamily protein
VVLIEDGGETVLKPGDAGGFKASVADGHQLVNRTAQDVGYLEIGMRSRRERAHYLDVDLLMERDEAGARYLHKNGERYK